MLAINLDRDDKNADWLHSLKRADKKVLKSKIYLKPQEKPPEGFRLQRGPRGGQYYETELKIKPKEEHEKAPPFKIDIDYVKDPELANAPLFVGFIKNFTRAKDLPEQLEELSDYKKIFAAELKSQKPELYNKIQKIHRALYRHAKYVARQTELVKLGKAHIDMRLFQHKIKIFEKVKDTRESLDRVSTVKTSVKINTGCNETTKIQFSNDVIVNAIFKPLEGESSGIRNGVDTLYNREVCAYELDQLFGLNLVPETVYKTIKGKIGSAQKWINNAISPVRMKTHDMLYEEVYCAQIFDYLISNTDRHTENFLFKEKHLILIDNGCCLSTHDYDTYSSLLAGAKLAQLDTSKLIDRFTSVPWSKIQNVLIKHKIPKQAINLCEMKFNLLKKLDHLPTDGEVRALFEPISHLW